MQVSRAEVDEVKDLRPSKQPRELPISERSEENLQRAHEAELDEQELTPSKNQLSKENLRLFNEEIDSAMSTTPTGSIKRSASQKSLSSQGTKISSSTNARYRFEILQPAQLNLHTDPPQHILDAICAIVNAELPEGRRDELNHIAREFQTRCKETVRSSAGENDFVIIFHDMLKLMNFDKLRFRTNADWDDQLKPKIQHSRYDVSGIFSIGGSQQQQSGDASALPPSKRQQQVVGQAYTASQPSMVDGMILPPANVSQKAIIMPPPVNVPSKEGTIKTPRPDITMGLQKSALISALSSEDLDEKEAGLFLFDLQRVTESLRPGELGEPMLISIPAPRASDLAVPFGVVEGKAYLTGQQLSAAENQAAVSGACALKIQLRLDELLKGKKVEPFKGQPPTGSHGLPAPSKHHFSKLPPPSDDQIPLFFSISTEGPVHVVWAHWTEVKHNRREYNMMPWKCVYGSLLDGLLEFFVTIDNILRWGTDHFLEWVVTRLQSVARKIRAQDSY